MALNPYQSHWTIKVKLAKLYGLRRFTSKKEPFEEVSVCTAVWVDDQATEIEGTFWREAAEYYHEKLQEGKVGEFQFLFLHECGCQGVLPWQFFGASSEQEIRIGRF